ncbi:hypothetical protein HK105_207184 [Polyrhizophydium stewartii]|uniref:Uncharacterized protein n=1 Tax=Polyrhizophydium stewartii TaxID=2732419 RepID=A0ABR4N1H8_9FUNG
MTPLDKGFVFTVKRRKDQGAAGAPLAPPPQASAPAGEAWPDGHHAASAPLAKKLASSGVVDMDVPLPVADTPRIVRNRQMREDGERRRRSSIGMRGKRISSALGDGDLPGLPHETIPSSEYYRLTDAEQSDPVRMRQLLVWCAQKAMEEMPSRMSSSSTSTDRIVREIQLEVIKGLHDKSINVSWYQRPAFARIAQTNENEGSSDTAPSQAGKRPHPLNVENAKKIETFNRQREAYEAEEAEWQEILAKHEKEHSILRSAKENKAVISYDLADIEPYLTPTFVSHVQHSTLPAELNEFAESMRKDLLLDDTIYHAKTASDMLSESCEATYSRMLQAFEMRDTAEAKLVDPADLLGLLSAAPKSAPSAGPATSGQPGAAGSGKAKDAADSSRA